MIDDDDCLVVTVMLAIRQIVKVTLMPIRLLLKTNVQVGLFHVTILAEQQQPLSYIPDEEWKIEQFALLSHMNEFMV